MSQAPVGDIAQLGVLVRVRSRERDRREQVFLARRRDHETREAELRHRREQLTSEQQLHETALRLRTSSPADALLGDYLIAQRSVIEALCCQEQEASDAVECSSRDLNQARSEHHRAQVRLDLLDSQLGIAQRHELRRRARKSEDDRPENLAASKVTL